MSKQNRFYVDFHVLQTVPPSCVNRDDTGSPKTAQYGGVTRARVSSQSWKHAMRSYFEENFDIQNSGARTKKIVDIVRKEISSIDGSLKQEEAAKKAKEALENAGLKIKDMEKGTGALFFISKSQAHALAELIVKNDSDKKKYKEAVKNYPSCDMALFGRMVANDTELNYDAASQVAHSISTHAVHNEFDYFTAVDDCSSEDNAGAGHLGTVEFNSATLYRYATVNVCELVKSLGADSANVVRMFAEAFCYSMPTGKQNTFANRTLPDLVYVTVRGDQPINLVGAFEKPIESKNTGYVEKSEVALIDYTKNVYQNFVQKPLLSLGSCVNPELSNIAEEQIPLGDLLDRLEQYVRENLPLSEKENV